MIGFNGGLIGGFRDTTGLASVPGVWTANEQVVAQRRGQWARLADPFFSSVSLLLPGNGTNGSTSIIDRSPSPKTVTANGNAQISTAQSKFGGSSILFDGSGDYLTIPRNAGFYPVANEDFTFELWVYITAHSADAVLIGSVEYGFSADWVIGINASRQFYMFFNVPPTGLTCTNTATLPLNTWTHLAVSRSGTGANNLRVFVNGIGASFSTNITTIYAATHVLSIGADQNGDESPFSGYMQDIRITKGVARYTANFTPPTAPHTLF